MEGGAGFHGFQGLQRTSYGPLVPEARKAQSKQNGTVAADGNPTNGGGAPACVVREQDRFMPIANVIRIMRKVLPTHAKISDDAKETIQECVSEYISFITSEANERCQREQRKTITAEDVLWAMSKLGFDDYIEPLSVYLHRYRELEGDHRGSIRGEPLITMKRASQPMIPSDPTAGALYGGLNFPPLPQPSFHVPPPPLAHHLGGVYGEGMGGYYVGMYGGGSDGSGAGTSHVSMASFDPYAPYK